MDEITLTRELGRETPLPAADRLAPTRDRLLAEIAPRPARRRRWAALAAAAAAVTAAAAAALIPAVQTQTAAPSRPADTATKAPKLQPVGAFLDEVARAAARDEDVVPRGDQYVYTKYAGADGSWTEMWSSVDGEHDSMYRESTGRQEVNPGCVDGKMRGIDSAGRPVLSDCEPAPSFRPELPTDPAALIRWVQRRNPDANGNANVNGIGKELSEIANGHWLRPAQRAALYRALGMIDGIILVPDAVDGTGRTGTGVAWVRPSDSTPTVEWIFDTETHALLGSPSSSVVIAPRIVDRLGQRP